MTIDSELFYLPEMLGEYNQPVHLGWDVSLNTELRIQFTINFRTSCIQLPCATTRSELPLQT